MNKVTEIRDNYYVTYGVFYSMGVLAFVPHYFFLTAVDYWMFKFRDPWRRDNEPIPTPPPERPPRVGGLASKLNNDGWGPPEQRNDGWGPPEQRNDGWGPPEQRNDGWGPPEQRNDGWGSPEQRNDGWGSPEQRTPLQASFSSSFSITCQISLLGFLIFMVLFSKKLPSAPKRIQGALCSMLVLFLINTGFTKINTDSFQVVFFGITIVLAILMNVCSAIIMVSQFQLATKLPLDYYATIMTGQAICGLISAILQICVLSVNVTFTTRGLIFFVVGSVIILATTIFYVVTKKKSKYFIYRISQPEGTATSELDTKFNLNMEKLRNALQRIKWFLGALVFVQGSTAMVYPGLTALIVSTNSDVDSESNWHDTYFVVVITYLGYHLVDLIGRESARKIKRPRGIIVILTAASVRLALVPLLMICNAQPRRHMPVVFDDGFYIILIGLLGFTQGYLVNLCIISITRVSRKEELEFVVILLPLFSVLSVTICSAFNFVIISLI